MSDAWVARWRTALLCNHQGGLCSPSLESRRPLGQHSSRACPQDSSAQAASDASLANPTSQAQHAIELQADCGLLYVATRPVQTNRSQLERQSTVLAAALLKNAAVAPPVEHSRGRRSRRVSPTRAPIHDYCSPCVSHVAERHRKARRSTRTRGPHAAAPRCTPTGCASMPSSSTA